jgi:SAM-dependent methyltransferase
MSNASQLATADAASCTSCGAEMHVFYELHSVPVNSCILIDNETDARNFPRGDICLAFCRACGFIRNVAFDANLTEYSGRYEETQGYSDTFQRYHRTLAEDLVNRYELHGKSVLEIGCGKGEFLALLCEIGGNRGLGFDPGFDDKRGVLDATPSAQVIADFYSDKYADRQADFVCCKMTLEHIPQPADFIGLSRKAMYTDSKSVFYLQVPESMRILRSCAFEDIYYEHCCYFTAGSLARLFRSQGLTPLQIYTSYGEQYLAIEAAHSDSGDGMVLDVENDLAAISKMVETFPQRNDARIVEWQRLLEENAALGPVVLWGSGSKAVSFLCAVDSDNLVEKVVDINPYRQGHFMPGSAQPIVAPEELAATPPAAVIIMNAIYKDEIATVLNKIGLNPTILAL